MSIVKVRGLKKSFGQNQVLKGVDLSVEPGEVTFLIGPSGGGKTTLLRCLNFLEMPDGGTIEVEGQTLCAEDDKGFRKAPDRDLRRARSRMSMVFQHFNLWNHKTALENVIEGPVIVQKRPRGEAIEEARRLLDRVGLRDKLDSYPAELSGGQKQRVGIARALAEEGRTMVVVSHEMGFARRSADRVHFVDGGRIAESGSPDTIFNNPQTERLKTFISAILH